MLVLLNSFVGVGASVCIGVRVVVAVGSGVGIGVAVGSGVDIGVAAFFYRNLLTINYFTIMLPIKNLFKLTNL